MPTKMMREEPLPMPYSVMRSPSHMTIVEPAISMMMTLAMVRYGASQPDSKAKRGLIAPWLLQPTTIPMPCTAASTSAT